MHTCKLALQDLTVLGPSNTAYFGNQLFGASEVYPRYPEADNVNNVERVVVPSPPAGTYVVRVTAPRVMTASQKVRLS